MSGANDHHVGGDDRSGMQPDFARHQIDLLVVVAFEIDDPVIAKTWDGSSSRRIERGPETLPVVSASRGEISGEAAYQVVDAENWRAMFDLDFSALEEGDDEPIDMRV